MFDESSKEGNQKFCLNDQLQEGPNTIPNIFDVLIKFRSKPVALTADIQSAFLQIAIDANDRDKLGFLWYDDLNSEQPKLVQFKFARLMFGLKPSPPILGCVVRHHVEKYENIEPEVVDEMKDLYVDDWATSFENTEEAFKNYKIAKQIMAEGSFNLRKSKSNDKELLCRINQEESKSNEEQSNKTEGEIAKVLGLQWNTNRDQFEFDFDKTINFAKSLTLTK